MSRSLRAVRFAVLVPAAFTWLACQGAEQAPGAAAEGGAAANPLVGVWRETGSVTTGASPDTVLNAQPSLYLFTPSHYAMMGTLGEGPRALHAAVQPTAEEKAASYDSFWGNSGTYEIRGDTLTIRPVVARVPNYAAGGYNSYQIRVVADTLWLTSKSSDQYSRYGDQIVPLPPPVSETRTTLVRVR